MSNLFIVLHKIKKDGENDGDKSGAPNSPTSEDSSSGNMSSNDDDEDCAAFTCLRPTGIFLIKKLSIRIILTNIVHFDRQGSRLGAMRRRL